MQFRIIPRSVPVKRLLSMKADDARESLSNRCAEHARIPDPVSMAPAGIEQGLYLERLLFWIHQCRSYVAAK